MLELMPRAAAAMAGVVRDVSPDALSAPTPCTDFTVRALVNHLLFFGPSLAAAGRKEVVPPPAAAESDVDLTAGDWAADLLAMLDDMSASWSTQAAWDGATRVLGPTETPAPVIGGMLVGEIALHGWDLARATGHPYPLDDELVSYLLEQLTMSAEQGRQMGAYGPEVAVPATAAPFDKVLGLTGRDPAWVSADAAARAAAG
jgi:uncharacterized protein (TIGR03086 family)